jgi:hypothetical protein
MDHHHLTSCEQPDQVEIVLVAHLTITAFKSWRHSTRRVHLPQYPKGQIMNLVLGDTRLILDACRKHGLLRNQAAYVLARLMRSADRFFSRPPFAMYRFIRSL